MCQPNCWLHRLRTAPHRPRGRCRQGQRPADREFHVQCHRHRSVDVSWDFDGDMMEDSTPTGVYDSLTSTAFCAALAIPEERWEPPPRFPTEQRMAESNPADGALLLVTRPWDLSSLASLLGQARGPTRGDNPSTYSPGSGGHDQRLHNSADGDAHRGPRSGNRAMTLDVVRGVVCGPRVSAPWGG